MFFTIKNLRAEDVEKTEKPWEFLTTHQINFDVPKEEYRKMYSKSTAEHCLVSFVEGMQPNTRVSKENEALFLHGYFADYDGIYVPEMISRLAENPPVPYLPSYIILTQSKKLRLAWLFQKPIKVLSTAYAHEFLETVAKNVHTTEWGSKYDVVASENPTQYMDIGREWKPFPNAQPIPFELLTKWDFDLFRKTCRKHVRIDVEVPIAAVAAEAERQFPGRAPKKFEPGIHCCRFWDPESDNQTGCVITDSGVRVFVPHDKPFMTWADIFGKEFTDDYESKTTVPLVNDIWYSSSRNSFWRLLRDRKMFVQRSEGNLRRDLKIEAGISDKPMKGELVSKLDDIIHMVQLTKEIAYAAPLIFREAGLVMLPNMSKPVLNTSLLTVVRPQGVHAPEDDAEKKLVPKRYADNPTACKWDNSYVTSHFPHIYKMLTGFFISNYSEWVKNGCPAYDPCSSLISLSNSNQLLTLLGWMAHFYRSSAELRPVPGQVLILSGDAGIGKTFFSRYVIGMMMGGAVDAQSYFIENSHFTGNIVGSPVLLLDDTVCEMKSRVRALFTQKLKSVVATGCLRYEEKFKDSVESVPWAGRVIITCNADPQALSVLPDLDSSNADKVTMLHLRRANFGDEVFSEDSTAGGYQKNMDWLVKEIPYFAWFLYNFQVPEQFRDRRFGVKAYQQAEMLAASADNGYTRLVLEALMSVIHHYELAQETAEAKQKLTFLKGTATELFSEITVNGDKILAQEIGGIRLLAMNLQILMRSGYNLTCNRDSNGTIEWTIPFDLRLTTKEEE